MKAPAWAGAALAVFFLAGCAGHQALPSLYDQGMDFERQGRLDDALAALRGAVSLDPSDPTPREAMARVYAERGWLASATQEWEEVLAGVSVGRDGPLRERAGGAAARSRASAALLKIYLARGSDAVRNALWAEAASDFKRATELDPGNAAAWPGLAGAADHLGDQAAAYLAYQRCFVILPGDPDLARAYGYAAHAMGKLDEALSAYRRCAVLKPGDAQAWNNAATVLVELGRFDESQAFFDRALGLDPGLIQALNGKASACYYQKRYDDARALWGKVLDLAPDDPTATRNMRTLVEMGL